MKRIIYAVALFSYTSITVAMDQDKQPLLTHQHNSTGKENNWTQKTRETIGNIGNQLIRNSALDILGKPGTRPYQLGLTYETLVELVKKNKNPELHKLAYLTVLRHVSPDAVYEDTNTESVPCSYQQNIHKDDTLGGYHFLPLCYNESWQKGLTMEEIEKKITQEAKEAKRNEPFFINKRVLNYTGELHAPLKHESGMFNLIQAKKHSPFEQSNPEPALTENLKNFCSAVSYKYLVFNSITQDVNKVLTTNEKDLGFTPVIEEKQFTQKELALLLKNLPRGLQHLEKFGTYLNKQETSSDLVIKKQKELVKALLPIYRTTLEKAQEHKKSDCIIL